jgi:DNA-directed RNA polymerase subunit M/transcription elongation factor TFIIS
MLVRDINRKVIAGLLGTELSEIEQKDLEIGIFNAALADAEHKKIRKNWENPIFVNVYNIISRRTITNLKPNSYIKNGRLLERLRDGEFKPHDIAFMNYGELFPENWQVLMEARMKRETKLLEGNTEGATDQFRCNRCNKRKCTYYEMQTRSADEPMTIFVRCVNCGKQWRQ